LIWLPTLEVLLAELVLSVELLPLLVVLLRLVEEPGALERRLDKRLVASEVSPDSKSLSKEVRALLSGLDLVDLMVWVELVLVK
jgi:hypothetical protein